MKATEKKGRGRPIAIPREERRKRILETAEKLFIQKGYAMTSMVDIAQHGEMSKRTIYQHFETKEMLFKALVEDIGAFAYPEPSNEDTADESIAQVLRALADYVLSPRHVAITRLVIAEADNFPNMREDYYEQGIKRGKMLLESRLDDLMKQQKIRTMPVEETADLLFGAALGTNLLESINTRKVFSREVMEAKINRVVELILEKFE